MLIQFQGEDRKDAIVNHFSLDIEEEYLFFEYIKEMGYTIDSEDELIESLYGMFIGKESKNKQKNDASNNHTQ